MDSLLTPGSLGRNVFMASCITMTLLIPTISNATTVSYYLDQSNIAAPTQYTDGTNYLKVTVDDNSGSGDLSFTIHSLSSLTNYADSTGNYGIDKFGVNFDMDPSNFIVNSIPSGWSVVAPPGVQQDDGFGLFNMQIEGDGTSRVTDFSFTVSGLGVGTTVNDILFAESMDKNWKTPAQGGVYFVAHVADIIDASSTNTSGFFGGLTPVPLPPAAVFLLSSLTILPIVRKRFISPTIKI